MRIEKEKYDLIYNKILKGDYGFAYSVLKDIVDLDLNDSELKREGILLVSSYNKNEHNKNLGIISFDDYQVGINRGIYRTLLFLDKIKFEVLVPSETDRKFNLYCSPEDISFVFNHAPVSRYKISSISTFFDNLIFGDKIYCDLGNEEIDREIISLLERFNIDSVFDFTINAAEIKFEVPPILNERIDKKWKSLSDKKVDFLNSSMDVFLNKFSYFDYSQLRIDFVYQYIREYNQSFKDLGFKEIIEERIIKVHEKNYFGLDVKKFKKEIDEDISEFMLNLFLPKDDEHYFAIKKSARETLDKICLSFMAALISNEHSTALDNNLTWIMNSEKSRIFANKPIFSSSKEVFLNSLSNERRKSYEVLNDFFYLKHNLNIEFPILFGYLVSKSSSLEEMFQISLELRNNKNLLDFKNICLDIDYHLSNGDSSKAVKLVQFINKSIHNIRRQYNVDLIEKQMSNIPYSFSPEKGNIKSNSSLFLSKIFNETQHDSFLIGKLEKFLQQL